jgi:hypothetical protein
VLLRYCKLMNLIGSLSLCNSNPINKIINYSPLGEMFRTNIANICLEISKFSRKKNILCQGVRRLWHMALHYIILHINFWNSIFLANLGSWNDYLMSRW